MEIMLEFIDGATMTYNEKGVLIRLTNQEGNVEDVTMYQLDGVTSDIYGIWFHRENCTIPWDEVINYENTDFHLERGMFLDNGQVIDEGEIIGMVINHGGGKVVEWEIGIEWTDDNNNVYCPECGLQYEVKVEENIQPSRCCFCGSDEIITRGDE